MWKGWGTARLIVRPVRRAVLEAHASRRLEEDVDNGALRGREQDFIHKRLVLIAAAITTDEFCARARDCEIEDACISGVHEIEPCDLAHSCLARKRRLAVDQHD